MLFETGVGVPSNFATACSALGASADTSEHVHEKKSPKVFGTTRLFVAPSALHLCERQPLELECSGVLPRVCAHHVSVAAQDVFVRQ